MATDVTLDLPAWWVQPSTGEEAMQQINVYQFYQIANVVHPLTEMKSGSPLKAYFYICIIARYWLHSLANDKVIPVPICRPVTWRTIKSINEIFPADQDAMNKLDMDKEVLPHEIYPVVEAAKEFETVFSAELQNMATYFVSRKGIYDTNDLIARADDIFTEIIKQ